MEIGCEMTEKSRLADGGKEKEERRKNNKKQNKNRKVFRLCRQTLTIEPLQPPIPLWRLSDKTQGVVWGPNPRFLLVSTVTNNPFLAIF